MYKYSWWVVPHNYTKIMRMYGMIHTPHVTIKTHMHFPDQSNTNIGKEFTMTFTGPMKHVQGGVGFSCEVENLGMYTMVIYYNTRELLGIANPGTIKGIFCCADTEHPWEDEWKVIYPISPRNYLVKETT